MNQDTARMLAQLQSAGISWHDACALRRISMTLHRWHELECGVEHGCIEREGDDCTGRPFWSSSYGHNSTIRRAYIPDREAGALKRLRAIMAKYAPLAYYIQGDPRGAALYIIRPGDVPDGQAVDAYYSRGLAVYK